ncbi:HAD-IIIA family hydrolase [Roseomonas sp. BN140053]|uniref:HAD-IIIA family hydrolase n=1 Tax=Roseomonas sp. BN140053 TaxID=3391898 RepID=UPI0039E98509
MKVVILNGGKGTRLGLSDRPKPMVPVAGRPLLERLLDVGKASGFEDYVFLNGHLAEVIEAHFGDGAGYGVRIRHVREAAPLGTAGAIREARALLTEPFLVIYGDILIDVDLAHFAAFHRARGGIGTLFVHPNDHPQDSDLVEADETGRIRRFLSKPHAAGAVLPNLVSAALYVLDPAAIGHVPPQGASDWGHDVFPAIVAAGGVLHAYRSLEYAKDIGTPDRLARGEADLASGRVERLSRRQPKPAVFLDRDGVLNAEINGVHRPDDLVLLDGAGAALRRINRSGIPAICVTNQPDVAKGLVSPEALRQVFAALDTALARDGAYLDDLYHCPHHPERGWPGEVAALKVDCECRKPKPGMLLAAARDHNLDLARSWMIGDRYADVVAAQAAGARAVLVRTGHGGSDRDRHDSTPDHVADNLAEAVDYVLRTLA